MFHWWLDLNLAAGGLTLNGGVDCTGWWALPPARSRSTARYRRRHRRRTWRDGAQAARPADTL